MSGLWGSCCMTSPGPMWENWCLWWVRCIITSPFQYIVNRNIFLLYCFEKNNSSSDDKIQAPPGLWRCLWKSSLLLRGHRNLHTRLLFSILLFFLSPTSLLELIRDLERLSLNVHTHMLTLYMYFCVIINSIFPLMISCLLC